MYAMKFYFTLFNLFCFGILYTSSFAQNPSVEEININKEIPGSTYKFSFVHISDLHIGEGIADYGTPGFYNDTMPTSDSSNPAIRLQKAVDWINAHELDKNIKFVLISGDLTGSAEKSEFEMCKKILDNLNMPYVPVIGNHDIWPYIKYQVEAPYAYGDSVMNEVFESRYNANKLFFTNWDDGERLTRTFNPETGLEHYLQNFSFEYDGFIFYGLDFNPRYHVNKAEPGIGPEAQLMDWTNGTFRWLSNKLATNPNKKNKNVFFFSHHPATDNLLFVLSGFVFDFDEYNKLITMLTPYKPNLALWLAGHIHIDYDYLLTNGIMRVRGIAANKDATNGKFEIINVYAAPETTTAIIQKSNPTLHIFPNPNNGKFSVSAEVFSPKSTLRLYDVVGNLIFEKPIQSYLSKEEQYTFDFSSLPKGSYLLNISDAKLTYSEHLVLQ